MTKAAAALTVVLLLVGCARFADEPDDPGSHVAIADDLTAVSFSDPGGAAAALESCQVEQYREMVTGMARIEHARDLPDYVPLTGLEPEIQTDQPAYVVRFEGDLPLGMQVRGGGAGDWSLRDPTCVVVGSNRSFFNTGGSYFADGSERSPGNGVRDPGGLPPLAP